MFMPFILWGSQASKLFNIVVTLSWSSKGNLQSVINRHNSQEKKKWVTEKYNEFHFYLSLLYILVKQNSIKLHTYMCLHIVWWSSLFWWLLITASHRSDFLCTTLECTNSIYFSLSLFLCLSPSHFSCESAVSQSVVGSMEPSLL